MKKLVVMIIIAVLLSAIPSVAYAAPSDGEPQRLNEVLVKAADNHLANQGDYPYGNTSVLITDSWEWIIGSGKSYWNQPGIGATGLLAAYERTGNTDYLDGAVATGDMLVAHYDSITDRPYSQDVEFLVRLASDSGDSSYMAKAAEYYGRVMAEYTAVENADRYINARLSLAGWDMASQIRAATEAGEAEYAKEMTARLIERRSDWEGILYGGWDYTMYGYTSLLWSIAELHDKSFNGFLGELKTIVIDAQGSDGSWGEGDYQLTAFAVLGLSANRMARGAQSRAWAFLRDSMTEYGGWSYPPEYGEVNSEVIMALSSIDLKGLKCGHVNHHRHRVKDQSKHKHDPVM